MREFDYITSPAKLLTPEIVQMVGSIHEHKGKQELFLEANIDELKTLLEVALIQSTGSRVYLQAIRVWKNWYVRKQNRVTALNRRLPDTVKCLQQSTIAMSISIQDRTLFCSCTEIYIPIRMGLLAAVIRTLIM